MSLYLSWPCGGTQSIVIAKIFHPGRTSFHLRGSEITLLRMHIFRAIVRIKKDNFW